MLNFTIRNTSSDFVTLATKSIMPRWSTRRYMNMKRLGEMQNEVSAEAV
jgi:hypothetical protein